MAHPRADRQPVEALRARLMKRAELWRAALERARRLADARASGVRDAATVVEDYRLLARDLATARALAPDSRAREFLEAAYAQSHITLHRPMVRPFHSFWTLLRDDVPAVVTALRPYIAWVVILFLLSLFAGAWLVHTYPDLIGLFASPQLIATVERGGLWTEGLLNVVPSSVLSLKVLTNNIVVSLFAWCAGFLFGLGTFYIVVLNGLMLGAVFAFTARYDLAARLFEFMVAHGLVEVSVLCLSGAAGAAVGEALIRPKLASRGESFRVAALHSGKLLFVCVLLLIGCGVIEGYISADAAIGFRTRIAVGVGYWLLMIAMLRGWLYGRTGRRRRAVRKASPASSRGAPETTEAPA